jgi:hypothetical protein
MVYAHRKRSERLEYILLQRAVNENQIHILVASDSVQLFNVLTIAIVLSSVVTSKLAHVHPDKNNKIKRRLQWVTGFLSLFPLLSGILGLTGIDNPLYRTELHDDIILDSNLRFLNAMSVGVAVSLYLLLRNLQNETTAFRLLMGIILCGAAGRLLSICVYSYPSLPFILIVFVELISPLVLVYWQNKIKE